MINNAGIALNSKFESIKTKDLDELLKQIYMHHFYSSESVYNNEKFWKNN